MKILSFREVKRLAHSECPSWDKIWVPSIRGSFYHTKLPFFICLSGTNELVFSQSLSHSCVALSLLTHRPGRVPFSTPVLV